MGHATGTDESLAHECNPKFTRCEDFPANHFAQCEYYPCEPNKPFCDGQVARICTENGNIPEAGTWCSLSTVCKGGTCLPIVCTPSERFCQDGDVWACAGDGTYTARSEACGIDQTCQPNDGGVGVSCQSTPCSPGAEICMNNQIGTCDDAGMAVGTVTSDCAGAGNVCTAARTCAKAAVDTLGEDSQLLIAEPGTVLGNLFKVKSSRKITNLEVSLVLTDAHDLRFLIFEEDGDYFHARIDKVVPNQQGSDYFSSGPLDYPLQAGKRYYLAVTSPASLGVVYDRAPFSTPVSFGVTQGGLTTGYELSLWGIKMRGVDLFHMRITTELPK